jgi:hypothetical protein
MELYTAFYLFCLTIVVAYISYKLSNTHSVPAHLVPHSVPAHLVPHSVPAHLISKKQDIRYGKNWILTAKSVDGQTDYTDVKVVISGSRNRALSGPPEFITRGAYVVYNDRGDNNTTFGFGLMGKKYTTIDYVSNDHPESGEFTFKPVNGNPEFYSIKMVADV